MKNPWLDFRWLASAGTLNVMVIDSEHVVRCAMAAGLPLEGLLEGGCMSCGTPIFCTDEDLAGFCKELGDRHDAFLCLECHERLGTIPQKKPAVPGARRTG